MDITIEPIGYIKSPFTNKEDIPRQSIFAEDKIGIIEIHEKYQEGLIGLDENKYIVVLFNFSDSNKTNMMVKTHSSDEMKGVFASRSPHRPNKIGMSIVEILSVKDGKIEFKGVDMLDNTPVIDIKPYSKGLNPKEY